MKVLVSYASKHGATQGIAERIAQKLTSRGFPAEARPVENTATLDGYDAFVVGSAAYMGKWRKPASDFVWKNRAVLGSHPTWLFSSGPVGASSTDHKGRDLVTTSVPKDISQLDEAVLAREHQVFFGAIDPGRLTLAERSLRKLPGGKGLLPGGDFRDWTAIDAWAANIASQLSDPDGDR